MGKEIITFGDIEVEKRKFNRYKYPIFLNDVNIDNTLVSRKIINISLVTQMKINRCYYT